MDGTGILIIFGLVIGLMFGPPVIAFIIGMKIRSQNPERAKYYFIFAGIYLLAGLGICASLLINV